MWPTHHWFFDVAELRCAQHVFDEVSRGLAPDQHEHVPTTVEKESARLGERLSCERKQIGLRDGAIVVGHVQCALHRKKTVVTDASCWKNKKSTQLDARRQMIVVKNVNAKYCMYYARDNPANSLFIAKREQCSSYPD